jgi:hypothetical protein
MARPSRDHDIYNIHGNEQQSPTSTRPETHVPNEAAIPTTPRNAPQSMAKRHRDFHRLLATQEHPREDAR